MDPREIEAELRYFRTAMRDANFALWGALLTFNGVLTSVFAAAALVQLDRTITLSMLVLCSMQSGVLLLRNFSVTKTLYKSLGSALRNGEEPPTKEARDSQLEEGSHANRRIEANEKWVQRILYAQALLIVVLLLDVTGILPWRLP